MIQYKTVLLYKIIFCTFYLLYNKYWFWDEPVYLGIFQCKIKLKYNSFFFVFKTPWTYNTLISTMQIGTNQKTFFFRSLGQTTYTNWEVDSKMWQYIYILNIINWRLLKTDLIGKLVKSLHWSRKKQTHMFRLSTTFSVSWKSAINIFIENFKQQYNKKSITLPS
jgi:hypothetical protein